MKFTIVMLGLLLMTSLVYADACQELVEGLPIEVGSGIPGYIPYSNEVFEISTLSGDIIGSVVLADKKVESYNCTAADDETYTVQIKDVDTVFAIKASTQPADDLDAALGETIIVDGTTFMKDVTFSVLSFGIKVASWFS